MHADKQVYASKSKKIEERLRPIIIIRESKVCSSGMKRALRLLDRKESKDYNNNDNKMEERVRFCSSRQDKCMHQLVSCI